MRTHARIAPWVAALPLATGAGLLVYVASRVSLWLCLAATAAVGGAATWSAWRSAGAARAELRRRAGHGVAAGVVATLAYDLSRLVLARAFEPTDSVFRALPIFGQLLAGHAAGGAAAWTVGAAYHFANGVGFAVAYALVARRPGVATGLAWAAFLELSMISIYPSWLGFKAAGEFVTISVLGHVAYGATLGHVVRRRRLAPASRSSTCERPPPALSPHA
jgi:hypothetical protein